MATTWDSSKKGPDFTLSSGNNVATIGVDFDECLASVHAITADTYFEVLFTGNGTNDYFRVGVANGSFDNNGGLGNDANAVCIVSDAGASAWFRNNGTQSGASYGSTLGSGTAIGIAVDWAGKQMWARANGGSWLGSGVGTPDPVAKTGGVSISGLGSTVYIAAGEFGNTDTLTLRSSSGSWGTSAPSGYGEINAAASSSVAEAGTAADTSSAATVRAGALAETGSAADTPATVLVAVATAAETGAAADTTTAATVRVGAVAETGSAADTVTTAQTAGAGVAENGAAADTPSAAQVIPATVAETGSAVDTSNGSLAGNTYNDSTAETGSAADTTNAATVCVGAVAETGSASDTVSAVQVAVASVSETGSAAETVASTAVLGASVAETGSAADTADFIPPQTYSASVSETAAANDNADGSGGTAVAGLPFGAGGGGTAFSKKRLQRIMEELRAEDAREAEKTRKQRKAERKQVKAARKLRDKRGEVPEQVESEATVEREAVAEPQSRSAPILAKPAALPPTTVTAALDRVEGIMAQITAALEQQAALLDEIEEDTDILFALRLTAA